jgi:hypothetical protein
MTTGDRERRSTPRVDLTTRLEGQLVTLDEPVVVEQLSAGGMTLRTRVPLPSHLTHEFRVWLGDEPVLLHGQVRHSRVCIADDDVTFVTGLRFVDAPAGVLERVALLVAAVRTDLPHAS